MKNQSKVWTLEEGKNPATIRANQTRLLSVRIFEFLLLFLGIGIVISIFSMYMIRYLGIENVIPPVIQSRILPCFQEPISGLEKWIKPPSNLLHNMNDSVLFWRASFVPQIKEYPYKRYPKIAFMFLTVGPLPLAPLWERFFKGYEGLYSIYLHSAPSYEADFPASSVFYRRQIPSQLAEWGRMSVCDAERRLLANALLDISNEWFILVSESCIPVQNFTVIYDYISRSRFSYMGSFDDPGPAGRGRYDNRMAPEVTLDNWRKGFQWFEVDRKLAIDIIEDNVYYPKFEQFCRPACYVDEHYFPTMLSIQSPHLLANRSVTFVDWSRGGAHPATFGIEDITEQLLKRISEDRTCIYNDQPSSLCFLFARKFAPSALDPLLEHSLKIFSF